MNRIGGSILIALCALLTPLGDVSACQCDFYELPICVQFWRADAVFSGTITKVDIIKGVIDVQRVEYQVTEAFRGATAGKIEVLQWVNMCNVPAREGQESLVFAAREGETGALWTGMCSHVNTWEGAESEIEHLRALARGRQERAIYGRFILPTTEPIEGALLIVTGKKFRQAVRTDRLGRFRVELPGAGEYSVHAVSGSKQPVLIYADDLFQEAGPATGTRAVYTFDVTERRCRYVEFRMFPNAD